MENMLKHFNILKDIYLGEWPLNLTAKAGICHIYLGNLSKADTLFKAFGLEIANDNVDSVVEITDKLKSLEHYEYALHYYLVLGRNQDDGILNLKIAQCYLSLEKGRGNSILLQNYEECWPKKKKKLPTLQLLIDEENHQLVIDLAKALASLGRYEDALDICKWTLNFVSDVISSDNTEELTLLGTQMAYNVIDPRRGFFRSIREKKKDCVPPIIISGHQFSVRSECQAAAEEYLHAYKLLPDSPFINLCIGTALINLAFDVRIKNKHQCVVQGVAFLFKENDYPIPQLSYESQHLRENQNSGYCSLHREAAYNLHLIYKTSGALGLARQTPPFISSVLFIRFNEVMHHQKGRGRDGGALNSIVYPRNQKKNLPCFQNKPFLVEIAYILYLAAFVVSVSSSSSSSDDDIKLRRGPWTIEEDNLLVHYITNHGEGRWNMLAKHAGLKRTGKSCRLRWLNYLKPDVKRGNLTPQEQLLILEFHSKLGNRWSKIAQYLPGRTDNEIKNYWRTRVQKQARNLKIDSNSAAFQEMIRCLWIPRLLQKIHSSSVIQPSIQSSRSTPQGFSLEKNNSSSTSSSRSSSSHSSSIYESPNIISEFPKIPREIGDSDLNSFVNAHFPFDDNSYDINNFGQLATGNFNDVMEYDQMSGENNMIGDVLADSFWSMDEFFYQTQDMSNCK
ncbi:hypothetical protein K7X08_024122 [Anisodus acutangulus]|uniref:Uncharacterized protein n=1 Tax=Anisodus acutangulus TaxID=402998 RepID=A0A9Q1M794_9SOLA|nr:hypothetical protein K7X08_024122 [Anisodus acutangulus]